MTRQCPAARSTANDDDVIFRAHKSLRVISLNQNPKQTKKLKFKIRDKHCAKTSSCRESKSQFECRNPKTQILTLSARHQNPNPKRSAFSITAGLIPRSFLRKVLFPDLLESVIPECFYRESRRDRNWTPDPFDVAQGRGEQDSRTTIKTFGGDAFGTNSHRYVLIPRQLAAG